MSAHVIIVLYGWQYNAGDCIIMFVLLIALWCNAVAVFFFLSICRIDMQSVIKVYS